MSWIFKDEPTGSPDPKAARTRAVLLSLPFALPGLVALVMFVPAELIGGVPRRKTITTLSFIAACFSISDPSGITAANNIAHKAEADWLVQQIIAGLKRPA